MNKPWAKGFRVYDVKPLCKLKRAEGGIQQGQLIITKVFIMSRLPFWWGWLPLLGSDYCTTENTCLHLSTTTHDSCPYRLISPHKLFVDGVKHLSSCEENRISALYEIKNLRGGILFIWEGKLGLQGKAASTYENSSHSPRLSATFTKMCRLG